MRPVGIEPTTFSLKGATLPTELWAHIQLCARGGVEPTGPCGREILSLLRLTNYATRWTFIMPGGLGRNCTAAYSLLQRNALLSWLPGHLKNIAFFIKFSKFSFYFFLAIRRFLAVFFSEVYCKNPKGNYFNRHIFFKNSAVLRVCV